MNYYLHLFYGHFNFICEGKNNGPKGKKLNILN